MKLAALGYHAVPADRAIALASSHARIVEHGRSAEVPLPSSRRAASPSTYLPGRRQPALGGSGTRLADAVNELNQVYRRHEPEVVTDEVRTATGRPVRSVDDWLAEHRDALAG